MLLSARILSNLVDVNTFDPALQVEFTQGDSGTFYLQLVDQTKDLDTKPRWRRFVPANGATLAITIKSIDDTKTLVKTASQPFTGDSSIWSFVINSTDGLVGTFSLRLALIQGGVTTYGFVKNALSISPQTGSFV